MKRMDLRNFVRTSTALDIGIMDTIKTAARDLNTVHITYVDSSGSYSEREVEPYEIKDGKLWAYCHEKGAIRQFTISHIMAATITNTKYRPRWAVKIL